MAETWKVPLVTALPLYVKSWNAKLYVSDSPAAVMSEAGRVNVMGVGVAPWGGLVQVSVTVMEVPAADVPSIMGAVLLVTGMPPMLAYGGVVGVSSRVGAAGAVVGAGCEMLLALSMNESVTGRLLDPAASVA